MIIYHVDGYVKIYRGMDRSAVGHCFIMTVSHVHGQILPGPGWIIFR